MKFFYTRLQVLCILRSKSFLTTPVSSTFMSFQQYSGSPDVLGVGGWEVYSWRIRSHLCCLWKLVQSQGIRLQGWGSAFLFPPEPLEGKVPYVFGRGGEGGTVQSQRVWSAGVVRGCGPQAWSVYTSFGTASGERKMWEVSCVEGRCLKRGGGKAYGKSLVGGAN